MVLFPPGKGGGEGVNYGYKGKVILIHSITDANGMPVVAITTPANGDERQQVLPLLDKIRLATLSSTLAIKQHSRASQTNI
jgi:hypothetical protein